MIERVLQAITELKQRGYKVGLYPFLMMDIAEDNTLPDPYGAALRSAYPWRGRISVHPASADQTGAASDQIDAFFGAADARFFSRRRWSAALFGRGEWSYRRFVLHNAKLAAIAGGVDAFLIGSEMRGITTARGSAKTFPAVAALQSLAAEARDAGRGRHDHLRRRLERVFRTSPRRWFWRRVLPPRSVVGGRQHRRDRD
ncbi:MAG: glycoside hydrolase TIM-barrel-like domain-containing protein [Caulobacteraceae bacterium]|nr:glycoside hydrolase TIM-barrel-like domain-containing protein [Caulobacteraceae bacterium]